MLAFEVNITKCINETGTVACKLLTDMLVFIDSRISLGTNYLALKCKNQGVYQYAVSFSPDVDSLFMRHRLIDEAAHALGPTNSFDGRILFLPLKLNNVSGLISL